MSVNVRERESPSLAVFRRRLLLTLPSSVQVTDAALGALYSNANSPNESPAKYSATIPPPWLNRSDWRNCLREATYSPDATM